MGIEIKRFRDLGVDKFKGIRVFVNENLEK